MKDVNYQTIIKGCKLILEGLGIDLENEHTRETPERMANAIVDICSGLLTDPPEIKTFDSNGYNDLVIVKDIPFTSLCAHHFMTFEGVVHVAYLPNKKIIGLSKIPRIVEYFSRRPQVQEEMVKQIADFIMEKIKPKGVMVVAQGRHQCAACRGIKKEHTFVTSAIRGIFENSDIRMETLSLLMK